MCIFERDVSAPDKDHAFRLASESQDAFVRQIVNCIESRYRRDRRPRSGSDENLFTADVLIANVKGMFIDEMACRVYEIKIPGLLDRLVDGVSSAGDGDIHPL